MPEHRSKDSAAKIVVIKKETLLSAPHLSKNWYFTHVLLENHGPTLNLPWLL